MGKEKEIVLDVDSLSEWCNEIDARKEGKELQEIVIALKETMRKNNLVSLAAPQIGYNRRVLCLRFGKDDYRTFVNPAIENNTGITFSREKCASIPEKEFIIPRFSNVKFFFTTPLGKIESAKLSGVAAFRFQHSLDHLNGMLVSDIGLEIDELFDQASEEEQNELLRMYAEALDLRQKELEKEVAQDPELSQLDDAIKFISSVKDGTTKLDMETERKLD